MAFTDREDLNFLGQLFLIGANQTPFLNMIGGMQGGKAATFDAFKFPVAQPWALNSASQNTQSEATAATAGTPTTYTRTQDVNYIQIMKYDYDVTFAKQSTIGEISGTSIAGIQQPVTDEGAFQRMGAMEQMAIDIEFSFLQGSGVETTTSATNGKTIGLENAITTNTVAAGGADITLSMIEELLREMADNGARFRNPVIFCNAWNKQKITKLYEFVPESRNVGGANIKQIETDFAMLGVQYAPQMPTDDIFIVEMDVCRPVFVPVDGQVFVDTPTAMVAAKKGAFLYTQIGLDFGPEEYHGSITGTSTS